MSNTPIIWYRVSRYVIKIEPVEVVSFTDKTVTVREKYVGWTRDYRHRHGNKYFPTFEEAKASLVRRSHDKLAFARKIIGLAQDNLAKAEGLVQP